MKYLRPDLFATCSHTTAKALRVSVGFCIGLSFTASTGACKKAATVVPEPEVEPVVELEAPPVAPLDDRVIKAQKLIAAGENQEALDLMDEALVDQPDLADLHYGRGMTLSFMERDDEALLAYNRAIELDAKHVPTRVARGNMYAFALGDAQQATPDFEAAIVNAPEYAPGYHGRGVIRFDTGDVPGAIADLTRAAELDGKNVNTLYILSQAHAAAKDPKAALEAASRAVDLEPGPSGADLRLLKAKLLFANGDAPAAIAEYEALAAIVPQSHDVRLQVGRGILQAGDPQKAVVHFEAVAIALPEEPSPLVNWARALAAKGDTEGALAKLDAALAIKKALPAAHVYKIEILSSAGQCKRALAAQRAFKKVGGDETTLARGQAAVDGCKAP